jgi:hypothetical protein
MSRPILPRWQVVDANGVPRAGARLYTYETGTNTPKPTFSDAGLTVPNANPVIADSSGTFPDIFFASGSYRVALHTAADAVIWTADPVDSLGTISAFMLTLLNDTNAEEARGTLGLAYATALQLQTGTSADLIVSPRRVSEWVAHRGHIAGLTLTNNGTDANNDLDIAEGVACSDGPPWRLMILAAPITKQLDAAWAVGQGAGGLDTGSKAANTWYHVFLIRRSDTGVVDALFSTSATSPTMPTGYDERRRIGAIRTDGSSNILPFLHAGDRFLRVAPALDFDGTIGTTASTITLASVPLGVAVEALLNVTIVNSGAQTRVLLSEMAQTDNAPSITASPLSTLGTGGDGNGISAQVRIVVNTAQQIRARATNASTTMRVVTVGYIDQRGRLA